jgi:hypothetical protein
VAFELSLWIKVWPLSCWTVNIFVSCSERGFRNAVSTGVLNYLLFCLPFVLLLLALLLRCIESETA